MIMITEKILSKKLTSQLSKKQDSLQKQPAVFANNYIVPNQINFNYVLVGNNIMPVYNDRVPARAGIKIWIGYDALDQSKGKSKRFQVLGTRSEDAAGGQSVSSSGSPHAKSHEWNAEGGGQDPLHVHQRAITFLRVGISTIAGNVKLYKGKIWTGTAFKNIPTQNIDLSTQIPSTPGKAAFVMISIDTSGAVVQTKGSEVNIEDLAEADRPAVPADTAFVSACVRVYYGQVKPQEGRANTDFDDLRFSGWNNGGGGGISDAPSDGTLYGRKDAAWAAVVGGGGSAGLLFEANRITNQSITAHVTPLDYDDVAVNVDSCFAAGIFTAPSDGLYMVVVTATSTTAQFVINEYINGVRKSDGGMMDGKRTNNTFVEFLNAGQTFELRTGNNFTIEGSSTYNWIRIVKLS